MSANISPIKDLDPQSHEYYFFDANIWIAILKNNYSNNSERGLQPYIDFFEAMVNLNSFSAKVAKKQPKIVLTGMLLSEVINAYLRSVAMPAYLNCAPGQGNFKKDYRENIHSDYDRQINILTSDINSFSFMFHLVDDCFSKISPLTHLSSLNREVDYNDLYYYELMKFLNIPIITHDKDFRFNDIQIYTNSYPLLKGCT